MASAQVQLSWLTTVDDQLVDEVRALVEEVVRTGGAVGWLSVPSQAEVVDWLAGWCDQDDRRLALCTVDGVVQAVGGWLGSAPVPLRHVAELTKVMTSPSSRGHGLGRLVVGALLDDLRERGFELVVLGVRGNNHPARRLYESMGFRVWGVLPRGVAVGEHRFDDVRMYQQLLLPGGIVDHGLAPTGPGAS